MNEITPIEQVTERMLTWGRNSALFRLNQRDMSEHELFVALKRKAGTKFPGITEECAQTLAQQTVLYCSELRLLNDNNYAEVKVRSGVNSGNSRKRIAMKLQEKGIDVEKANNALEEVDDARAAIIYCRKRAFGPFRRGDADQARHNKELSGLARQGFPFDLSKKVLGLSFEDANDVLDGHLTLD
ncbi:regulatory protein RecX [Rhizobium sp. MHM7A]|uniref:regulatory protein RecX n=1 Tax=Rhizobium sp. MHM7A TaxID=2583233 RepID=UPI0011059B67|nr:regulatory protein RecX [Rhizobium sp. MHM7A]TLX15821.1 regulatory protein RecX [Rhizobium sp. MHM7A]